MALYPNILLIASTGETIGKTTLACKLIEHFKALKITAIKISPNYNFVSLDNNDTLVSRHFIVENEIDEDSSKDSGRMLNAGAEKVFSVETNSKYIYSAFYSIYTKIDPKTPVIIESTDLIHHINAGVCILVSNIYYDDKLLKPIELLKADKMVFFNGRSFDINFNDIEFKDGHWVID